MQGIGQCIVLNLKRRPDRLKKFEKECPFYPVIVFESIDGYKEIPTWGIEKIRKRNKKVRCGEFGCLLSHFMVWSYLVENPELKSICVMEDDCHFSADCKERWESIANYIPFLKDKDSEPFFLFLGGRFEKDFVSEGMVLSTFHPEIVYRRGVWNPRHHDRCFHAYVLNVNMAKYLIQEFEKNDFNLPVDGQTIHIFEKNKIPYYHMQPLPIWSPRAYSSKDGSDIQGNLKLV